MIISAAIILALGALVSLWPVLSAPVAADDRYWTVETPARFGNSYAEVLIGTWEDTPAFARAGRFTPLANVARRVVGLATFQAALVLTTPYPAIHGSVKLLLLMGGIGACLLYLRALRWRSESGQLVRASRDTIVTVGVACTALVAAGVTSHYQFRNPWTAYPVLTYGAVLAVFGSAAALVAVARRVAEEKFAAKTLAVASSILLSLILNWTYELYYVGVPLALFTLFVFPLMPTTHIGAQRRARRLVGGTFTGSFVVGFIATRIMLSGICTGDDCYAGTSIELGMGVLRTFWFHIVTALPGGIGAEFVRDMESVGAPVGSNIYVGKMWLVSLGLGVALWVLWRRFGESADGASQQAERHMLNLAGVIAIATGLGGALIMSLSAQSQEIIVRAGIPYRHGVLTWLALSFAGALLFRSWVLSATRSSRVVPTTALALLVVATSAFTLPRNIYATRAHTNLLSNSAIAEVHWELIKGDTSDLGDERRCESFERAEHALTSPWVVNRLEPAADRLFQDLWDLPYCSTWSAPGASAPTTPASLKLT